MKDIDLVNLINYRINIINFIDLLKKIGSNIDMASLINNICVFLNNIDISSRSFFYNLEMFTFNIEEKLANGEVLNIENEKTHMKSILLNLYKDIISQSNINIYLLGKDRYGFINDKYTDINIKKIESLDSIYKEFDSSNEKSYYILFVENMSLLKNINLDCRIDKVYDYENVMNQIQEISKKIYLNDYNYYFLKYELKNAKNSECDTLILGNSYPLVGIDKNKLNKKALNLSMHSQDLYYSYKLAKECISVNKSIKRCVIGVGYYLTYHDLSIGLSDYSKDMVKNIYMPILNDMHNAKNVEESTNLKISDYIDDDIILGIFNLDNIFKYITWSFYLQNNVYFNDFNKRVGMLGRNSIDKLSEDEKIQLGKRRADSHNNLMKYSKTNIELKNTLEEFLFFLTDKGVEIIITVFPSTKYYNRHISKEYKNRFYEVINYLKKSIEFKLIDFNEYGDFNEYDFIDMDHLGECGCDKVTTYLKDIIY